MKRVCVGLDAGEGNEILDLSEVVTLIEVNRKEEAA
jgi:hypothetical protein